MKVETPKLNITFHFVTAAIVFIVYVLLTWVSDKRINNFVQHQNSIASKVASLTALEISTYIKNGRNLLGVLNKSYLNELIELKKDPSNNALRRSIHDKISLIFPELIEFTLTSSKGALILPKISEFVVGETCRRNISAYFQGHLEAIYIHSNPNPINYHFDILTLLNLPNEEPIVLFMSLNTSIIENILKNRPPLGHYFFLINGSESRFIEVSSEGHKAMLTRPTILSGSEKKLINANIKIEGTSWNLISTFNQPSINAFTKQINNQKYLFLLISLLAAMIASFLFYRTDKKRLFAELRTLNQNVILEEKVNLRTKELTYRATHDALTKLINRGEFERRLGESLSLAKSDQAQSILMYLDLDQFKIVNDTAGHAAGDELLIEVSSLLKSQLRRGDTLARLGGDEFGVLLNHCDLKRATTIAEQLRVIIHNYNFEWGTYSFTIGVSIGVIEMNDESPKLSEILSLVDAACYMAKDLGRNQYYIYNNDDTIFEAKQSSMYQAELALSSIKNNQLILHAQKIFGINSLNVPNEPYEWYEVLVRIQRNDSLIYPDNFIPALEKFGHITSLDKAVVRQAISFLAANPKFKFSINLSGLSIIKPELINVIKEAITRHKVKPNRVCFEITESAAIGNLNKVKIFIAELHKLGCSIALDDFGTGMSSFSYLSNLDVDYIKLDGSFVKDIDTNALHYTMVDSINAIVKSMNKFVIAEYVETQAVSDKLEHIGIAFGQGYHIHRPEKLDDIVSS